MNMKKTKYVLAFLLTAACLLMAACSKDTGITIKPDYDKANASEAKNKEEQTSHENDTKDQAETANPETGSEESGSDAEVTVDDAGEHEYRDIKFIITNTTGTEIGMVSTLTPIEEEQMDLGSLPDGQAITLDMKWPLDVTIFNLGIYNGLGELVTFTEVDITGVSEKVVITITGDSSIDSIDAKID